MMWTFALLLLLVGTTLYVSGLMISGFLYLKLFLVLATTFLLADAVCHSGHSFRH